MREGYSVEHEEPEERKPRTDLLFLDLDELVRNRGEMESRASNFNWREELPVLFDERAAELVSPRFDAMVERLAAETKIVDEIDDTVHKENLTANPGERDFPVTVEFGLAKTRDEDSLERGNYSDESKTIEIMKDEPDKVQLWAELAYSGVPEVVRTLDHELIHYWQREGRSNIDKLKSFISDLPARLYSSMAGLAFAAAKKIEEAGGGAISASAAGLVKRRARRLSYLSMFSRVSHGDKGRPQKLQEEIVAQKAGRVFDKKMNTTHSVIQNLVGSYGYGSPADLDRIIVTSQVVDRLRSLGFNHKDIAFKLARTKYDPKGASYPELEAQIEQLAAENGLTVHDLDTMTDIMRIGYEAENAKAMLIAQEEVAALRTEVESL